MSLDRETLMMSLCYWIVCCGLIWGFLWQWSPMPWPVAAALTVAAGPISLLMATYERRSEGRLARAREALRSEGRFEDAAAQDDGVYYGLGRLWAWSYMALAGFFVLGGILLASPACLLGALFFGGWGAWRLRRYSQWQEEDLVHQRTSEQRIATATDGLKKGGWRDRATAQVTAANRPSASDDASAGPTS
jgi:hypothetical protein